MMPDRRDSAAHLIANRDSAFGQDRLVTQRPFVGEGQSPISTGCNGADDDLALRLSEYDEQLRQGGMPGSAVPSIYDEANGLDSSPLHECLNLLERAWPRGASVQNPEVPARIGRFQLERVLGVGGFGIVYLAVDPALNRKVALKVPRLHSLSNAKLRERFKREARATAALDHPHIVPIHQTGETGTICYIASAYCPGPNLAEWLKSQTGPVPVRVAATLVKALAEAVEYSHSRGVLHRDLKPSNVLLAPRTAANGPAVQDGLPFVPRLTDFGLAKLAGEDLELTAVTTVIGTAAYMAPEQTGAAPGQIGPWTDVYGLGAMLYELLTGRPPFVGGSVVETLDQVRNCEPVLPRLLNPGVPRDLETICLKCLEKDAVRRFAAATELANELGRYLHGEPIRSLPIGKLDRSVRWCRRRPATAGLIGVSALMAIGFVTGLVVYTRDLSRLNTDLGKAVATATEMQTRASEGERRAKDSLYAADVAGAAKAWRDGDTRAMLELLNAHLPNGGEPDRRGFEWWYLHRQANLAYRRLLQVDAPLFALGYCPQRRLLATAGKDAIVRLFDADTGAIWKEFPTGQIEVNGVAFSPDGAELATAGDDGSICLWDLEDERERLKFFFRDPPGKAYQPLYTPDGARLVICGDDPLIHIFDARSGLKIHALEGHYKNAVGNLATVESLRLDADGKTLASTSSDQTARIWDLESREEICRVLCERVIGPVVLAKDRHLMITGNDGGLLKTWDARAGKELARRRHFDRMASLELHPDGKLLAASDHSGCIRLWNLDSDGGLDACNSWQAHRGCAAALLWAPDGSRLISAGDDGQVMSWSLSAALGRGPRKSAISGRLKMSRIPHSSLLAVAKVKATREGLTLWDWQEGRHVATIDDGLYETVVASRDGRFIAATTTQGDLRLFRVPNDLQAPAEGPLGQWHSPAPLSSVEFSPDGRSIMAAGQVPADGQWHAWRIELPDLNQIERLPVQDVKRATYSPDGQRLAFWTFNGIVLWDILKGRKLWEAPQPDGMLAMFSPDGRLVVSRISPRAWIARSALDGTQVLSLASHRATILTLDFSPDGRTLATGDSDGIVKLWHVPTGKELFDLTQPPGFCEHVEFADDGKHLLCCIEDETAGYVVVFEAGETPEQK